MDKTEFKDFAAGFVAECAKSGLTEEQTASLLVKAASMMEEGHVKSAISWNPMKMFRGGAKFPFQMPSKGMPHGAPPLPKVPHVPKPPSAFRQFAGKALNKPFGNIGGVNLTAKRVLGAGALYGGYKGYEGLKGMYNDRHGDLPNMGAPLDEWGDSGSTGNNYGSSGGGSNSFGMSANSTAVPNYSPFDSFYGSPSADSSSASSSMANSLQGGGAATGSNFAQNGSVFNTESAGVRSQMDSLARKEANLRNQISMAENRAGADPRALTQLQDLDMQLQNLRAEKSTLAGNLESMRDRYIDKQEGLDGRNLAMSRQINDVKSRFQPYVREGSRRLLDERKADQSGTWYNAPVRLGQKFVNRVQGYNPERVQAAGRLTEHARDLQSQQHRSNPNYYHAFGDPN
jgi:hypothetical protein